MPIPDEWTFWRVPQLCIRPRWPPEAKHGGQFIREDAMT